VHVRAIEE
jgi:hypothetical protein